MTLKTIFTLTLFFVLFSCGPRSGTSNLPLDNIPAENTPDLNQVQYIKNVFAFGPKIYKENCAGCHCGPGSNCEPPFTGNLRPYFINLPMDSLEYLESYIKNSSVTKKSLRISPFVDASAYNYTHNFENTLSDSLIRTVIEYLWLGYKDVD